MKTHYPNTEDVEGSFTPASDTFDQRSIRWIRSLRELYENCTFVLNVTNPISYKEAAESQE